MKSTPTEKIVIAPMISTAIRRATETGPHIYYIDGDGLCAVLHSHGPSQVVGRIIEDARFVLMTDARHQEHGQLVEHIHQIEGWTVVSTAQREVLQ